MASNGYDRQRPQRGEGRGEGYFEHEKLIVYHKALEVVRLLAARRAAFAGCSWLYQQAIRAAESVVSNIAEGASLRARGAKNRHYLVAKASCGELAGQLDIADAIGVRGLGEIAARNREVGRMLGGLSN